MYRPCRTQDSTHPPWAALLGQFSAKPRGGGTLCSTSILLCACEAFGRNQFGRVSCGLFRIQKRTPNPKKLFKGRGKSRPNCHFQPNYSWAWDGNSQESPRRWKGLVDIFPWTDESLVGACTLPVSRKSARKFVRSMGRVISSP